MEKFQKYCFGVLLVIIYSNISVQAGKEILQHEDYKEFYQLCSQILESGIESPASAEIDDISSYRHKEITGHFTVNIFSGKKQGSVYNNIPEAACLSIEKHSLLLKNFEKQGNENRFAGILYFKTKVSKVRNKDYLSAIG